MQDLTFDDFEERTGLITDLDEIEALGLEADEDNGSFDPRRLGELQEFCHNRSSFHIVTSLDDDTYVNEVAIANRVAYFLANGSREPLSCELPNS